MRFFRKLLRVLFSILALLLVIAIALIGPINRKPFQETIEYQEMMTAIEKLEFPQQDKDSISLMAGWKSVNITPDFPIKLVGYRPRGPHQSVHDSLFARIVVFDNEETEVVMVSIDMLLFPPILKDRLTQRLPEIGLTIEQTYFSASHSHTSFGGWSDAVAGRFIAGEYHAELMDDLADKIVKGIKEAQKRKRVTQLGFGKIDASEWVENRLDKENGEVDSCLRFIKLEQEDGKQGVIVSFSAHATNISKRILELSGDYPNVLVSQLEKQDSIDFALFCAGMVGSHRAQKYGMKNFELTDSLGKALSQKVISIFPKVEVNPIQSIILKQLPIPLPKSQLRIGKNLKVRHWGFEQFLGDWEANMTIFKVGDILMLGMPCDFSGEIAIERDFETLAQAKDLNLMITSFNGEYIGYITSDEHYDTKRKEEVRAMNWVGPHKGAYFGDIVEGVLERF